LKADTGAGLLFLKLGFATFFGGAGFGIGFGLDFAGVFFVTFLVGVCFFLDDEPELLVVGLE
jgi:hypothetical protein